MAGEKYSEERDLQRGVGVSIFLGGVLVAYCISHEGGLDVDTEETSSKMSGMWKDYTAGKKGWSFNAEALVSVTKGHNSLQKLINTAADSKPVDFEEAEVTVAIGSDGNKTATKGAVRFKGKCYLTNISHKSPMEGRETISCKMTGTGPLFDGAGNEIGSAKALQALGVGG